MKKLEDLLYELARKYDGIPGFDVCKDVERDVRAEYPGYTVIALWDQDETAYIVKKFPSILKRLNQSPEDFQLSTIILWNICGNIIIAKNK